MSDLGVLGLVIGVGVILRISTSLHPYSGQSKPRMYGDYEAQRHWQEITVHVPLKDWYRNTTNNDLEYWGLDYPPLTAYHSLLLGKMANFWNPSFVELKTSRGFESDDHKQFMRLSVLLADLLLFIPAVVLYFHSSEPSDSSKELSKSSQPSNKSSESSESSKSSRLPEDFRKSYKEPLKSSKKSLKSAESSKKSSKSSKETLDTSESSTKSPQSSKESEKSEKSFKSHKNTSQSLECSVKSSTLLESPPILDLKSSHLLMLSSLLYPGLILIDHGHFQYNSISLGLFILAVLFMSKKLISLASIFFVLALNYKQMELYHSLPFFFHILGLSLRMSRDSWCSSLGLILKTAVVVLGTFFIIWGPFIIEWPAALDVLFRLFPVGRGLFEDKVANIWCALNVIVKLKEILTPAQLLKITFFVTVSSVLPSNIHLLLRPTRKTFLLALINTSLGFFLFSFQVHEKSILLVAVPVMLHFGDDPFFCFWFLIISSFSMIPLILKDQLGLAFCGTLGFYSVAVGMMFPQVLQTWRYLGGSRVRQTSGRIAFWGSMFGAIFLAFACAFVPPPGKYPDLFPLLVSVYSCAHFLGFLIYFNVKQILGTG
ncbi:dolichyl pyrophosphate Man9GlcNAc2 alpha-1,3-glucosyltransferase [Fopius arisanus]|uniref:Alpha-1,3-glucosyltransferase n=2 Tax=Fopius arisanus TaxID=64838 RepID=A0A9R1TW98_9HYME|nr:PREDICTED: dolichyl pyrophosphate Man9GlcNAc2 alpha-1,3-glucosyltransferase [Fopius arisanus]